MTVTAIFFNEALILQVVHCRAGTPANVGRDLQRHRGRDGRQLGEIECLHRLASTETGNWYWQRWIAARFLKYVVAPWRQFACGGYRVDESVVNTARVSESEHVVGLLVGD